MFLFLACADGGGDSRLPRDQWPDLSGDADTDSDTDSDSDADTDSDTDADSDTDTDADTPTGSGPCEFPQGVPDEGFVAWAGDYEDTDPTVDADVNAVMEALTGCGAGSTCDLSTYAGASVDEQCQSWFAAVTAALRDRGYCAGQHSVGSTDEIAVSATGCGGRWYGYHVCYYGGPTVVWNPGARRGWWQIDPAWCG